MGSGRQIKLSGKAIHVLEVGSQATMPWHSRGEGIWGGTDRDCYSSPFSPLRAPHRVYFVLSLKSQSTQNEGGTTYIPRAMGGSWQCWWWGRKIKRMKVIDGTAESTNPEDSLTSELSVCEQSIILLFSQFWVELSVKCLQKHAVYYSTIINPHLTDERTESQVKGTKGLYRQ